MAGRRHRRVSTRKEAGFSQERLAEVLGVERSTVMRWECGETSPQLWARPKLARALGISDQLLSKLLDESADFHTQPEVPITAYADELLGLLNTPMSDRDSIALNTTVVGVHAQAGLWACHMHKPSVAYRYLATSRALGALSYLFSSAPRGGRGGNPQHCLNPLDEAISLARRGDPFTRGWLATWRADQYATLGKLAAAQADVEMASAELGAPDNSQLEGFFARSTYGYGMEGHLNSVRAVVFALAGDDQQSLRTFNQVQVSAANMRRRIATYGHQALVQVDRRDPEAACTTLGSSIQLAAQEHYTMGIERMIGVRQRFDANWSTLPAVRCLDDELHNLSVL